MERGRGEVNTREADRVDDKEERGGILSLPLLLAGAQWCDVCGGGIMNQGKT